MPIFSVNLTLEVEQTFRRGNNMETALRGVRRLYQDAQAKFVEADARYDSSAEYWRGQIDALYAVLSLLQGPETEVS
jgi:hypothetical protein